MSKTFIIAEAATTWHIGKSAAHHLAKAIKCIHVAKEAGADCCKFQWTSAPAEMAKRRHIDNVGAYHRLAFPVKWFPILAAECEQEGIEFMVTCYLPQDVATIAPYVKRFKIASLEAMDYAFVDRCAEYNKPILISTGALTLDELNELVDAPAYWERVQYLLCTAGYPAPIDSLNLRVLRRAIRIDGLSDHSGDFLTGAIAVGVGAEIVEVHFRLDETRKDNPDFNHSHSPASLAQYIALIRRAELMLGDGVKKIEDCERSLIPHRVTA